MVQWNKLCKVDSKFEIIFKQSKECSIINYSAWCKNIVYGEILRRGKWSKHLKGKTFSRSETKDQVFQKSKKYHSKQTSNMKLLLIWKSNTNFMIKLKLFHDQAQTISWSGWNFAVWELESFVCQISLIRKNDIACMLVHTLNCVLAWWKNQIEMKTWCNLTNDIRVFEKISFKLNMKAVGRNRAFVAVCFNFWNKVGKFKYVSKTMPKLSYKVKNQWNCVWKTKVYDHSLSCRYTHMLSEILVGGETVTRLLKLHWHQFLAVLSAHYFLRKYSSCLHLNQILCVRSLKIINVIQKISKQHELATFRNLRLQCKFRKKWTGQK